METGCKSSLEHAKEEQKLLKKTAGASLWYKFDIKHELFEEYIKFTLYGKSEGLTEQEETKVAETKQTLENINKFEEIQIHVAYLYGVYDEGMRIFPIFRVKTDENRDINYLGSHVFVDYALVVDDTWCPLETGRYPQGHYVYPKNGIYRTNGKIEEGQCSSWIVTVVKKSLPFLIRLSPLLQFTRFGAAIATFLTTLQAYLNGDGYLMNVIACGGLAAVGIMSGVLSMPNLNATIRSILELLNKGTKTCVHYISKFKMYNNVIESIINSTYGKKCISFVGNAVSGAYKTCVSFFKNLFFPAQNVKRGIEYMPSPTAKTPRFVPFEEFCALYLKDVTGNINERNVSTSNTSKNRFVPFQTFADLQLEGVTQNRRISEGNVPSSNTWNTQATFVPFDQVLSAYVRAN